MIWHQSLFCRILEVTADDCYWKYATLHAYNPHEEYEDVESTLCSHLESFLETARSFNMICTKEIHPWTHMMEVPQLHGFGPAANRLLEAYKMLLKVSQ
ncbi:putative plant AUGMIN subunit 7 protein [Rosa chinensis]|uniref:Putative plant AUGMIN subunit 7 protein n=1 Tax=Rosa chinensis TaxID=74649 RepID=A0A2P6RAW3_ROSCH|nr:putative plant AUGMIN subunit 7 protein [Rosa chinensis]